MYDLTDYISLVIKLNILNHMMIFASAYYSFNSEIETLISIFDLILVAFS